nr:hypothetical protein [Chiayiivirga flava]
MPIWLCGVHSLGFALFHLAFWRLFDWPRDLRSCSVATRAVTQILNLRLTYVFLAVAAACFFLADDLLGTRLGHCLLGAMSLFWLGRLIEQALFLRFNHWGLHVLSVLFALGAVLFAWPLLAA